MSVTENVISERYRTERFSRYGLLDWAAARKFAEGIIADYDVKCPSPEARIRLLSGGNMQKLILGRALDPDPSVILANQPTRGLDVGAVGYVHRKLVEARGRGAAILLISEDLEEILALVGPHPRDVEGPAFAAIGARRTFRPRAWRVDGRHVVEDGGHLMRLEPKPAPPLAVTLLYPLGAVAATLVITSLLVLAAGASPFSVFYLVAKGAAGSQFALLETLTRATPLIFTGLAVAVAFRARLWNIGAEAQLYMGGVVTVVLGTGALPLPAILLIPIIMLVAMAAGASLLLGPAVLKTRFGVDEVVTTLLLNFIVLLFVSMLLEGPLKDPTGLGWPQSAKVVAEAQLPRIIQGKRLHYGFVIAIVAAVGLLGDHEKDGVRLRDARRRPQSAGSKLRRHSGRQRADEDGAPVGRAGGARGLFGSLRPQGQSQPRPVAGLRLFGHRRRDAGHAQPHRRRRLRHLRRRHLRRRRRYEPGRESAELHRRRDGRDLAAHHGRGDPLHAVQGEVEVMEVFHAFLGPARDLFRSCGDWLRRLGALPSPLRGGSASELSAAKLVRRGGG